MPVVAAAAAAAASIVYRLHAKAPELYRPGVGMGMLAAIHFTFATNPMNLNHQIIALYRERLISFL